MNWRKLFAWCVFAVPVGLVLWWFEWSWRCALADWSWPKPSWPMLAMGAGVATSFLALVAFITWTAPAWVDAIANGFGALVGWSREPWRKDDPSKPRTF